MKDIGVIAFAFTDDTLLIASANSKQRLDEEVRRITSVINEVFEELGLRLNYSKTEILLFTNIPRKLRAHCKWKVDCLQIGPNIVTSRGQSST